LLLCKVIFGHILLPSGTLYEEYWKATRHGCLFSS
jgi:hypothetical protein